MQYKHNYAALEQCVWKSQRWDVDHLLTWQSPSAGPCDTKYSSVWSYLALQTQPQAPNNAQEDKA